MFVDKVPPPREVLTLRGCTAEGLLRHALSPEGEGTALLGDVCVEVWDEEQPLQWWTLVDTVVLTHHPNRLDPALVDVVVGAGVEEEHAWVHTVPTEPTFKVFVGTATSDAPAGHCWDVDGLFASRCGPGPVPMHLVGCEAAEPLRALLNKRRKDDRDWAQLWALDRHGRVMYRHNVYLGIETVRPSILGAELLDITLTDGGGRPPLTARPVWETWYRGVPTSRNQWAPYTTAGRAEWLDLTASGMNDQGPDRSAGVHHLDGRFVTDVPGLHCAMAEALIGPGGYFGRGWNAFRDCLCGGFGIALPFTLIWHDSHVAQRAFADDISDFENGLTYFEEIVQLLERYGATVELR